MQIQLLSSEMKSMMYKSARYLTLECMYLVTFVCSQIIEYTFASFFKEKVKNMKSLNTVASQQKLK